MADPVSATLAWVASAAAAAGSTAATAGSTAAAAGMTAAEISAAGLGAAGTAGGISAGVSAATGIAGSIFSSQMQSKAASAAAQSAKLQRQAQELQTARERSDAIRQARMSMGEATQAGANQGTLGSSASQGGIGSIRSQLAGNLSFLDNYSLLTQKAGAAESSANQFALNAQTGAAISQLGFSAYSWAGSQQGQDAINKVGGFFKRG